MNTPLHDVLDGRAENRILPFLWFRGEGEARIREEIAQIHGSGIGAVVVEARPHPDFYGPRWWEEFEAVMDESRRRGMKVWLLDDDHFPSGNAAGKNRHSPQHLKKRFIKECHVDALGPQPHATLHVAGWFPREDPSATLLAAVAIRREVGSARLGSERIDLTDRVAAGLLHWEVPEGYWRVFFVIETAEGGPERYRHHVNPLVAESVRVLIDAVYEPMYEKYRADFGKTFSGFFSDEPGFYNDRTAFDYESKPGKKGVELPWCPGLLEELSAAAQADFRPLLPLLWHEGGDATRRARHAYMDTVSRRYGDSFAGQIGKWCRERGVEYIGHILEDNGVHARLGPSAGHFFRALDGQDMGGCDVVLWQLVPGYDAGPYASATSAEADGEFYHYGLAKLASSHGHLDPKKKGRAMAEVYGAYGWREGLKLMKWMTDHMLVRGVNHFVPHAYSMADFPHGDCPPHFYARGRNPQHRHMGVLFRYLNRVSHLLTGGVHVAPAAILYHAQAEWASLDKAEAMHFHRPLAALLRQQVDADVMPEATLMETARVEGGKLLCQGERFHCLVVPYAEVLPSQLARHLAQLGEQGLPIFFVDGFPMKILEPGEATLLSRLTENKRAQVVSLDELPRAVRRAGDLIPFCQSTQPWLRTFHMRHDALEALMVFNEHPHFTVRSRVSLPLSTPLAYDGLENRLRQVEGSMVEGHFQTDLVLEPYESLVFVSGPGLGDLPAQAIPGKTKSQIPLEGPWSLSCAEAMEYPTFPPPRPLANLKAVLHPGKLGDFSGIFRYQTSFQFSEPGIFALLDLGDVFETAEVWVNGKPAGTRIAPPYRFEVGSLLRPGANELRIEVTNTLVKSQRDRLSLYAPEEPSGLLGPVVIHF